MNNINAAIEKKAKSLGFDECFFLAPQKSTIETEELECNLPLHYPDWSCLVLLVYAYLPFEQDEYIPAYYIASNKSYHAFRDLIGALNSDGIEAVKVHVPVKYAAEAAHIGSMGKNTLLHFQRYGSRVVLHTLLAKGAEPKEYNLVPKDLCKNCTLCQKACPTGAIGKDGFIRKRCIREYMESPPYPDFVKENIHTYLGCELCMNVCPYNSHLKKAKVDEKIRSALSPERILSGDVKAAKSFVGSNISTKRLKADAEALSSRQ